MANKRRGFNCLVGRSFGGVSASIGCSMCVQFYTSAEVHKVRQVLSENANTVLVRYSY